MTGVTEVWSKPASWEWMNFADVAEIAQDLVSPADVLDQPHIAPNNIGSGDRQLLPYRTVREDAVISPKQRFFPGQILFVKIRPYLLKSVKVDFSGVCSADMYPLWAKETITPEYLLLWLTSSDFRDVIAHLQGRTVLPKINQATLNATPVPTPPVQEQRRIVAKIDRLFAHSKRARDELEQGALLTKRFRQRVLSSAFQGTLTQKWRVEAGEPGSASDLVHELATARASLKCGTRRAGRADSSDLARKPVEIAFIPSEWAVSSLEQVSSPNRLIQYGILVPGPDQQDGVPYAKVMNIRGGVVELHAIKRTTRKVHDAYRRSSLKEGDLLLTIRGTVGRVAFVPPELDGGNITQDTVRIDIIEGVVPGFVYWYLQSPSAQNYFEQNKKGIAVKGINVGDVRPMELPLPSFAEQQEIVRRIEHAFAVIDRLAAEAQSARALLDRLDQAILAKAFRGELVPQEPND